MKYTGELVDYESLIVRIKAGDDTAFKLLYECFYAPLYVFAGRYIQESSVREDCVQDVFASIWSGRHELSVNISIKSYLYASTRNNCLNIIKRKKLNLSYEQSLRNTYDEYTAEDLYSVEELRNILNTAIDNLPPKYQEVFRLSRFQKLTYKEIAEKKEISIKTVEAYISKSLALVSVQVKKYFK